MYCTRCGAPNVDDAKFCSKCGGAVANAPSPAPASRAHAAPDAPAHAASPTAAPSQGIVFPTIPTGRITDLRGARAAALMGVVAAVFAIVFAIAGKPAVGNAAYASALLSAAIAFGIWRMSRIAALFGFLQSLGSILWLFPLTHGNLEGVPVWIFVVISFFYFCAVRGTLAYHRLRSAGSATA